MTLSFTAMSDKWRRVSGAKVQQIIDMDKEKKGFFIHNLLILLILRRTSNLFPNPFSVHFLRPFFCSFLSCKRKGTKECTTPKAPFKEPTEKVALFEAGLHILTSR